MKSLSSSWKLRRQQEASMQSISQLGNTWLVRGRRDGDLAVRRVLDVPALRHVQNVVRVQEFTPHAHAVRADRSGS